VSMPQVASALSQGVDGVAAASSSNVWAVGSWTDTSYHSHTLIEHWDGSGWSIVPSPSPLASGTATGSDSLDGVAALPSGEVWAVGESTPGSSGEQAQALIERWDGRTWSVDSVPASGYGDFLRSVSAAGPNDVFAVGLSGVGALSEHWDGSSWIGGPTDEPESQTGALYAVAALGGGQAWAAGALQYPTAGQPSALIESTILPQPAVTLSTGWNLIDVPVPDASLLHASALIGTIESGYPNTTVQALAGYHDGRFSLYVPGYSAQVAIKPTDGLFVLVSSRTTWVPPGSVPAVAVPVALTPGWNLVAAPAPPLGLTAEDVASQANCGVNVIVTLSSGAYHAWVPGDADVAIPATSGMWIECGHASTWTPG
jgi:hypothetical protein